MKNSWFFSLALLLFTCSIQAQSRFEFWPQGHINVLADFKGGYYVTMGGPSFTLLKKDQLQAGVHFAPSLRIKPSAPEGREIMPPEPASVDCRLSLNWSRLIPKVVRINSVAEVQLSEQARGK